MLKAIRAATRTVKDTVGISQGEDAEAKKNLIEIKDAASTLHKTLNYFWKTFADHAANTHSTHEDMANLYPANQSLSVSIAKLNNAASLFLETPKEIEEVRKSIDASIAELLAKVEELISLANKRASARAEISHYQDKIAKLADDAKSAGDPKKQGKAESNQAKLQEVTIEFRRLDEEIKAGISTLDDDMAKLTNASFTKFMQLQAKNAHSLLGIYTESLDNIAPSVPKAAAAEAPASAE